MTVKDVLEYLIEKEKEYVQIIMNQLNEFDCDCCCNKEKLILKGRLFQSEIDLQILKDLESLTIKKESQKD